jgi:O-antigen/teichoic acid export membrane protein
MRAMHQITHPITTQFMAQNKWGELQELYQKTSITLQVIAGWIMLGILCNLDSIYAFLPNSYRLAMGVVVLLSISKYFDAMLGNNNSIIFNSKYYQTVLMLGFGLLAVAVILNWLLIPCYGIDGVAWATLISMGLYNLSKLYFVVFKMKLFPFTLKTLYSLIIVMILGFLFNRINLAFAPLYSILIKSIILTIVYFGLHYYFKISTDINEIIHKVLSLKKSHT